MAITVYVIEYNNLVGIVDDLSCLEEREFGTRKEAIEFMIHKSDELVDRLDKDFELCEIILGTNSITLKVIDEEFDAPTEGCVTIREEVRYELEF